MDIFRQDVRYALRTLSGNSRFVLIAVFTLALGIGSTTVVFSAVYNLLIAPFPYSHFDRVITFTARDLGGGDGRQYFPIPHFELIREQNRIFEDLVGFYECDVRYQTDEGTRQAAGACGTSNLLQFFGVPPLIGRVFTSDDVTGNAFPVFVVSYRTWRTVFNGDPNVIGKSFVLSDRPRTLIGVMPARFEPFNGAAIYLPLSLTAGAEGTSFFGRPASLRVLGRLEQGVSLNSAQADLNVLLHRIATTDARYPARFSVVVTAVRDMITGPLKPTLLALSLGVVLLLLIACSNVANLLFVRATAREREMAIRASLGASPARLFQQMVVESFLLSLLASLAGCVAAYAGVRALPLILADRAVPGEVVIGFQPAVAAFAIAIGVLTTVLCGIAPALHVVRGNLNVQLATGRKGIGESSRHRNVRNALVVVQIAISIVLLVGAGLMFRTMLSLTNVDLGIPSEKIVYAQLATPVGRYDRGDQKAELIRPILDRLQSLPGVNAVTESTSWPPDARGDGTLISMAGTVKGQALIEMISEGYFSTLGLHTLRGRLLTASESDSARHLAVVNESFAHHFFPSMNPVGQMISLSGFDGIPYQPPNAIHTAEFEIIGVVSDYRNSGLRHAPTPEAFIPYTVTGVVLNRTIMIRSSVDPNSLLKTTGHAIRPVDPDVGIGKSGTIASYVNDAYYRDPRFEMRILSILAGLGLSLVAVAVFSIMAYTVALQTHDIGVRMALGADPGRIVQMVLKRGIGLIVSGIIIGAAVSTVLTKFLTTQLWGVSPYDPQTFVAVGLTIMFVGLMASLIPANRAAQVDPVKALRQE